MIPPFGFGSKDTSKKGSGFGKIVKVNEALRAQAN